MARPGSAPAPPLGSSRVSGPAPWRRALVAPGGTWVGRRAPAWFAATCGKQHNAGRAHPFVPGVPEKFAAGEAVLCWFVLCVRLPPLCVVATCERVVADPL